MDPADIFAAQAVFTATHLLAGQASLVNTGGFVLIRSPAANRRGYNEFYRLAVNSGNGDLAAIAVYLVDDWIAVNVGQNRWLLTTYRPDTPFVAAVQTADRLPTALVPLLEQAQDKESVVIAGQPAINYRLEQPGLLAALLPDLPGASASTPLHESADVWLADPSGDVVRLELQATLASVDGETAGAAPAAQSLAVAYNVVPEATSLRPVVWPEDAPTPGPIEVPGFASGTFPVPPGAARVYPAGGSLELIVNASMDEIVGYYQDNLAEIGWSFAGDRGVYSAANAGVGIVLLISSEQDSDVTRVIVLTAP